MTDQDFCNCSSHRRCGYCLERLRETRYLTLMARLPSGTAFYPSFVALRDRFEDGDPLEDFR